MHHFSARRLTLQHLSKYIAMPSRKKDRGKQRKAAKQSSNGLAGIASPMAPEIKEFMAQGGRVDWGRDNGTSRISHPCLKHIKEAMAVTLPGP